jgi:hypothetical protein
MGPPGEPGPVGPTVGQAFKEEGVNFTYSDEANEYRYIFDIPQEIEVLDSDIVAVYWLWDEDGEAGNIWQPLPASVYFEDGSEMQYTFDHTVLDVQLLLYGNTDLSTVGDEYTQGQTFKVVILPADYVQANNIDLNNFQEVMEVVDQSKIQQLQPAK